MFITFHFADDDYSNYTVEIDNKTYVINQDDCKINIENYEPKLSVKLSYIQDNISFGRVVGALFLELIKMPLFIIFETTASYKWYESTPLNDFSYTFNIDCDSKNNVNIYLQNSFVNDKNVYFPPNISSKSNIVFVDESSSYNFSDLKMNMLKYCFKLFWLVFALEIIFVFALKYSMFIIAFIVAFLLLMFMLIVKAISKYKSIKNSSVKQTILY